MTRGLMDFGAGVLIGGLGLSACWGFFWLAIGLAGLIRKTCSWRVVLNSLTVGVVPLILILGLFWWYGGASAVSPAFGAGVLGMPIVLFGLGLRQAPDGQRAGVHMLDGMRNLMDKLLGKHQGCGGCSHDHDHEGCA